VQALGLPARLRLATAESALGALVGVVAYAAVAGAQPLTGSWQLVATATSNTCAEPLGPRPAHTLAIEQAGDLIAADSPDPNVIDFAGVVSGANVSIGFAVASGDRLEIYDPALNVLAITAGGTRLEGDLHWERFEPLGCTGTQTWTAEKDGAGTPGNLSGDWTITAAELTESCGPIDPTALPIPAAIQQEGDLVRIVANVDLGQTQWTGRVAGIELAAGVGLRQSGFTIFDSAQGDLAIDPGFGAFAGVVGWSSYDASTCSGVDAVVATLPEPGAVLGPLAAVAALVGRRRISS